ncbi:MAG TPA: DedA family protein [Candidatus Binataceae bacterium]|nr:DedA family protein [Candidatus Binataceae bacterium]
MSGLVSHYIQHFSYAGLFLTLLLCGLGLPVPEDLALLTGGFLVYRGITSYPLTLAISFVGVVVGDNCLYFLGRRFGTGLVSYIKIWPDSHRRLERLKRFMDRHGHLAIFYARFLAGARALVYVTAGSLGIDFGRFVLYDSLGALISVPIVVTLGYRFGAQIEHALAYIGGVQRIIWVVLIAVALFLASRAFISRGAPRAGSELTP